MLRQIYPIQLNVYMLTAQGTLQVHVHVPRPQHMDMLTPRSIIPQHTQLHVHIHVYMYKCTYAHTLYKISYLRAPPGYIEKQVIQKLPLD